MNWSDADWFDRGIGVFFLLLGVVAIALGAALCTGLWLSVIQFYRVVFP